MAYFPMMIDLKDKPVLVIGGGAEGAGKVRILRSFGAIITLIAVDAQPEAINISDLYIEAAFTDEELDRREYVLAVAATDDRELNRHISEQAGRRKIPVNVVDDVELCSFIFPAIYQSGDVVCAVSSGGKSPYVAQYIRDRIRADLPVNIGEINDRMGEFRGYVKEKYPDAKERRRILKDRFNELIIG